MVLTLKWNQGVHNWMVYGFGDIPVGAYENRPEGWNVWLTFAISNAAPTSTVTPTRHSITK
jgi:hypothetical protein